jgi:hypothetical protein
MPLKPNQESLPGAPHTVRRRSAIQPWAQAFLLDAIVSQIFQTDNSWESN